ncbi:hypothetical protein [Nitrosomonas oligotropha]|uniref:hypothetical protein n=1 Tax=Nitrosomonas oligotropha TaxID=42354 RepID=UPI001369F902|nr:hypothetical protein [Nitrosomonas oligotropha]
MAYLANLPGISRCIHTEAGTGQTLIEIYRIGNTKVLPVEEVSSLPCVDRVVRISGEYRAALVGCYQAA